jgi:hypothetical protein
MSVSIVEACAGAITAPRIATEPPSNKELRNMDFPPEEILIVQRQNDLTEKAASQIS